MPRQAAQRHSPGLQVQKEQYVIGDQATPGQDFDCEEIRAGQHRHMRLDEFLPGGLLFALRRWRQAITLQCIPHRLIRDLMAEVRQCAYDPIVPPAEVFLRQADDQGFDRRIDPRAPRIRTAFRSVELARNQSTVPGQDRESSVRHGRRRFLQHRKYVVNDGPHKFLILFSVDVQQPVRGLEELDAFEKHSRVI